MKAQKAQMYKGIGWQVRQYFSLLWLWQSVFGQVHYSIVEESRKGSKVGNIASDLGLNVKELTFKRLRIDSHVSEKYFTINLENGELCSKEKIDRETLCASVSTCILTFDVVVENPLNVFHMAVEIQDINDNPPRFSQKIIELEISEVTSVGTCFVLQNAEDPDVGINSIRNYRLSRNQNFVLKVKNYTQENVFPELVLEKALDRETQNTYELILTAVDGGNPIRTGTVFIRIYVTDFNDNFPEFSEEIYKANVKESTSVNSTILFVNATDKDEGFNADITYSIGNIPENVLYTFSIHPKTGEIKNKVHLDFEKTSNYEMSVQAKDGGGLVAHAKVLIHIIDENDNAPEISISSLSTPIPENSTPGTVIALIKVYDQDSGKNGDLDCKIIDLVPFKLVPSSSIYFTIITTTVLDRELVSQYNITVVATDRGFPALFTTKVIFLSVSDINDNSPVFENSQYIAYVSENNQPGASIYKVHALDLDAAENATLTYSILTENMDVFPVFSYLSINPTTGVLYAQRSFDYEEHKEFYIQVIAKDNGSPQLSNNASIEICVVDKNDNAPKILYPLSETEGSPSYEIVPFAAGQNTLITKVIAVDSDSGHNAWLSYHFIHLSELSLFSINQQTGEIRTLRAFQEKDPLRQKVVVLVKDNGDPSLSATVTLSLVVADDYQQVFPEITNQLSNSDSPPNMQIYLIVAIGLISFLFTLTVTLAVTSKCKESKPPMTFGSLNTNIYSQVDPAFLSTFNKGTLQLPYSYDVCVALDSSENDFTFLKPNQSVPVASLIDADDGETGNESLREPLSTSNITQVS